MRSKRYDVTTVYAQCQDYFSTDGDVCQCTMFNRLCDNVKKRPQQSSTYFTRWQSICSRYINSTHRLADGQALYLLIIERAGGPITRGGRQAFIIDYLEVSTRKQNITIGSTNDFLTTNIFKLTLYSKEAGRYLCFNKHWKLVGMKNLKEGCHFIESLDRGYFEFRSAVNRSCRVGFTRRFRPVGIQQRQDLADACFHFTKTKAEYFDPAVGRKSSVATKTKTIAKTRRNNQRINKTNRHNNINNGHNSTLSNHGTSINNNSNLSQTNHNNNNSKSLQPKILVRHHNDNSSIVERRRQHHREQKIRQRRKYHQNQVTESSSSTNLSAKSTSTMLAPSVLNIVATLAASGRTTRDRRKNDDLREDEEDDDDADDEAAEKQKKIVTSTAPAASQYLSPKNPEHRHRHHHHLHHHNPHHLNRVIEDHPSDDYDDGGDINLSIEEEGEKQRKSTATSGLIQFPNEYSNKNSNTNNINNNYLAIPALPKNLYNNTRMTEYVYSGSTNVNNNSNFNKNNNNDNDSNSSSSSYSFSGSHSKEMKMNNNYNIDNNFKDYLNTTKNKDNANRKNLFEAIKNNNNNKIKNIVQYRYAVSFISAEDCSTDLF